MWPGCTNCGEAVPKIDDKFCGGSICINKNKITTATSKHKPFTKKKLTREMIIKRRKSGRRRLKS